MAVYNLNGDNISNVYNLNGDLLHQVYNLDGNELLQNRLLVFEDNFTNIDTTKWGFELGKVRNQELQYYTDDGNNVSIVPGGGLCITAKRESFMGSDWTSASLTSKNKFAFKYGRIEAKILFPYVAGAFPAFWTLGDNHGTVYYRDGVTWATQTGVLWALCGENDIVEHYPGQSNRVTCGGIYDIGNGTKSAGRAYKNVDMSKYHIYACEWTETKMSYYIDGVEWSSFDITDDMAVPYRNPHYMLLNLAVGASGGTPESTTNEFKMYVDWVRIYAPLES